MTAENALGAHEDGSSTAGLVGIGYAILAVAEELERPSALAELDDRTGDLMLELVDVKRRLADLELAMRALAPTVDVTPAETRQRLEHLESRVEVLTSRFDAEVAEGNATRQRIQRLESTAEVLDVSLTRAIDAIDTHDHA